MRPSAVPSRTSQVAATAIPFHLGTLALGVFLMASVCKADEAIHQYVVQTLRQGRVPGAAVTVVQNGRVVEEIVYGVASAQLNVPVQRTTRFQLASVTKTLTGIVLLMLEQEHALSLTDEVGKYLPDLPMAWRYVTLMELATHTSGLPDVIQSPDRPLSATELTLTESDALRAATLRAQHSPAGDRYDYNQTNFVLLKEVIERVTHESFRVVLLSRLFPNDPSALPWGDCRPIMPQRADMYTALHGTAIENGTNLYLYPPYLEAAAGLNATIGEMEAIGVAMTNGSLLRSSALEKLLEPRQRRDGGPIDMGSEYQVEGTLWPSIGLLYADNSAGHFPRLFMAGGSAAAVMFFPRQHLFVAVLTNLQARQDPLAIAEGIARNYIDGLRSIF